MGRYMLLIALFIVSSCKKDEEETPQPQPSPPAQNVLTLNLKYKVDANTLSFDSLIYTNAAGNPYSVTRLQYYLSNFKFTNSSGGSWSSSDIYYIDGRNTSSITFSLPFNSYTGCSFNIGLDSSHNISNSLPNTIENTNMAWPDMMGGGYHFLKLEGNFTNLSQTFGYAMHIGKTVNLVTANIDESFTTSATNNSLSLVMNINEWFVNPHVYDFNIDGNYSMTDNAAMAKLTANGADVFSIE